MILLTSSRPMPIQHGYNYCCNCERRRHKCVIVFAAAHYWLFVFENGHHDVVVVIKLMARRFDIDWWWHCSFVTAT